MAYFDNNLGRVRRVEINGAQLVRMRMERYVDNRALPGRESIGVTIITDTHKTTARLKDFETANLDHVLQPGLFKQSYVVGGVVSHAESLLHSNRHIVARAVPNTDKMIEFEKLAFGYNGTDTALVYHCPRGDQWDDREIEAGIFPYQSNPMDLLAQVVHYGSGLFEGGKAFRQLDGSIVSFRMDAGARRIHRGAERLFMTPLSERFYMEAVSRAVLENERLIAPPGLGAALYLRPFHFASGQQLGVSTAPFETFAVVVSPVGPYFKGGFAGKRMKVETYYRRSAPGLTGDIKAIGNYAASILPGGMAKASGHVRFGELGRNARKKWEALRAAELINEYGVMASFNDDIMKLESLKFRLSDQEVMEVFEVLTHSHFNEVIYLDQTGQNIEEVGAANAFVVKNNVLYTPALTGTILPGITRDSILVIAKELGLDVVEGSTPLKALMEADEVFCTGTAAVVTPISSVTMNNETSIFCDGEVGPITRQLYDLLIGIQEGRVLKHPEWITRIKDAS